MSRSHDVLCKSRVWMAFALVGIMTSPQGGAAHEASPLRAPDGAERPRGEVRLDETELRVRGEDLAPGEDLTIWLEGGDGILVPAYELRTQSNGSFDLRHSVTGSSWLGGAVEVRAGDDLRLLGMFSGSLRQEDTGTGAALLAPPAPEPSTASGRVRTKAVDGRHAVEVKVRGLELRAVYSVRVLSPDGDVAPLGRLTTNAAGNGALEVDTHDGGLLPFGVDGVAALAGLAIEVVGEDESIALVGTIPALGEREHDDEAQVQVEFDLRRPSPAIEPNIEGDVTIETESLSDDKVRVRLRDAQPGAFYTARVIHPETGDATPLVSTLEVDSRGEAEVIEKGDAVLPFGAASISELAGVVVEIVDADERVVLEGTVPSVAGPIPPPVPVERLKVIVGLSTPEPAPIPAAHGKIELEEEDDVHQIEIEIQDLVVGAAYRVELRDPLGLAAVLVEAEADPLGNVRAELVILGSEPLPLGVGSLREFSGFSIVVVDSTETIVLEGTVELGGSGAAFSPPASFGMVGEYDAAFLRGDANRDFVIDITDPIRTLESLFLGRSMPTCLDALDTNDDGGVDISDPVLVLLYLFSGNDAIPYPGARIAGFDPTEDGLFCNDA